MNLLFPPKKKRALHFAFRTFVASIFYVGKGTGLRPFAHFYDAIKAMESGVASTNGKAKRSSEKIQQIHDIWAKGVGVVSHHFFQVWTEPWEFETGSHLTIFCGTYEPCLMLTALL